MQKYKEICIYTNKYVPLRAFWLNETFLVNMKQKITNILYIAIVVMLGLSLLCGFLQAQGWISLGKASWIGSWVTSPVALVIGLVFALTLGKAYPAFNKTMSKKLLQYSVVGLGFGMNVNAALASGKEGMLFTIVSVFGTLFLGWLIGRKLLKVDKETSYLISSGTAICGGSAIAATGPIIKAKPEQMSVALGVVFILNAIALFVFPHIGSALTMSMKQFGMWAAIAIHDTSSVVGAGSAYDGMHPDWLAEQGVSALEVATTVKLTRALWIVVLALVTPFFFRSATQEGETRTAWYKTIPNFIVWFIVAILLNTYVLSSSRFFTFCGFEGAEQIASAGALFSKSVGSLAKHLITLSLFFIGASLTRETLRQVGWKPFLQGVLLWICISCISLMYILLV